MKRNTHIVPHKRFLIRTPLFPVKYMYDNRSRNSSEFKEAVYLASSEFYSQFNNVLTGKKFDRFNDTIYKYLSRCCTRSTPFGIFAGCSVGRIDEKNEVIFAPINNYQKHTRLDMQYLCKLIQAIERDAKVRGKLKFYANNTLYRIGCDYRYVEVRYINDSRRYFTVNLETSEYIEMVLSAAKAGATIYDFVRLLTDEGIDDDEANDFILDLIKTQVLISELSVSVVGKNALDTLMEKLYRIGDDVYFPLLQRVKASLNGIDKSMIGEGMPQYEVAVEAIKDLPMDFDIKHLFHVDLYKPTITASINAEVVNELAKLIYILDTTADKFTNERLEKFKRAFYERYEDEEIPLLIAIDNEIGLGYPYDNNKDKNDINVLIDDLSFPYESKRKAKDNSVNPLLLRKLVDCVRSGANTIMLSDDDFIHIGKQATISPFYTVSVTFSLLSDITGEHSIYVRSINNMNAIGIMGRFTYLNQEINSLVQEIADVEECNNKDIIYAEISHLPETRIGNIACRDVRREKVIHYLSNEHEDEEHSIHLSDLYLSMRYGNLILRSKTLNKEVRPKLSCAHNYQLDSMPLYYFLCDLSTQESQKLYHVPQWGGVFKNLDYLPQIKYGNIILSRQRWMVRKDEISEAYMIVQDDLLIQFFERLISCRNIPQNVVIPEGDNEMFVDFTRSDSIRAMLQHIKGRPYVLFEDFLFQSETGAVTDVYNRVFTNEFVLCFDVYGK